MSYKRYTATCLSCKLEVSSNNIEKHYGSKACLSKKKYVKPVRNSLLCEFCGVKKLTNNSLAQHEIRCDNNPNRIRVSSEECTCMFCHLLLKSLAAKGNHERTCKLNPNRKHGLNQFTKARENGTEYIVSESTRALLSEKITSWNNKRWSKEENRKRQSVSMKRAVLENPESYSSSNRGRTKQIIFDGIKFQGSWELIFYKWAKQQGLNPKRVTEGFPYVWNGNRTYFPDFYLDVKDLYIEVKGYKTDRDEAKWSQFPKKLLVVDKSAIDKIKNNCYTLS